MKSVSELITELCPNGVPCVPIGDFAECISGATPSSTVTRFWEDGTIPWMSSGEVNKGVVLETDNYITQEGFDSCSTKMVPAGSVVMALAGQGKTRGMVARIAISLCTNQSLCSIITNGDVSSDFLYHYLKGQYQTLRSLSSGDGGRGGLNLQIIRNFKVPVPPIKVQQEIVRILDTFTKLEAELEAELEARETQYEHYRNHILSFRDTEENGVRWIELGDICQYRKERSKSPAGTFMYVGVEDLLQERRGVSDDARFLSSTGHDIFMPGDVLLGNIRPYLKKVWRADVEGRTNGDVLVVTPKQEAMTELDTSYLYFLLSSDDFFGYCVQTSKGAKMPRGDKQAILRYEIPVPSIETQRRIVKVLTSFESLTQDLEFGLPAEISARRQQYEYYRNKLLTFKELEVA